jgi:hypothetical protein
LLSKVSSTSTPVAALSPEFTSVSVKVTVWPGVTTVVRVVVGLGGAADRSGVPSTVSVSELGVAPLPPSAAAPTVTWLSIVVPSASGLFTSTS